MALPQLAGQAPRHGHVRMQLVDDFDWVGYGKSRRAYWAINMADIKLSDTTLSSCVEAPHGHVRLENCRALSCVKGRDGVTVKGGSCAGAACSSHGRVSLEDTTADAVVGRDGVRLVNTATSWVEAIMGAVSIRGGRCGSVRGRDDVEVTDATVVDVTSTLEDVRLHGTTAGAVYGNRGVCLVDATVGDVTSRRKASIRNSRCGDVSGNDGVTVTGSKVGRIESHHAGVSLQDSSAADVVGRGDVDLANTTTDRVKSSLGTVSIRGGGCGDVKAQRGVTVHDARVGAIVTEVGDVLLSGVRARGDVVADHGAVSAQGCTLRGVRAWANITLTNTTATEVVLMIPAQQPHGYLAVTGEVQCVRVLLERAPLFTPLPRLTVHVSGLQCIRDGITFDDCHGDVVEG